MSINILDDEVLKRNKQLISNIEDDKTLIEAEEENKKTQFAVLYDGDPKKALEDARRNIEIDISSANNRTPTQNIENDPRTNEINFEGFEKDGEKWNQLSSSNPGVTKSNISVNLENRDNLNNTYSVEDVSNSNISLEGFEKGADGKWKKLASPTNPGIEKTTENLENRDSLNNAYSVEDTEENKKTQFAVLYDGNPRKAVEDAKRNIEIDISSANNRTPTQNVQNDPKTNEINFQPFEKDGEKWNKLSSPNPGVTKSNISIDLENRDELDSKKQISSNSELVNGILKEQENRIRVSKLINEEGKLIDPEDAKEDEEFPIGRISRRDFREIEEEDVTNSNNISLEGFEKDAAGKWKELVSPTNPGIEKTTENLENRDSLNNAYSVENVINSNNISLEGFEKDEAGTGKWKELVSPTNPGIEKTNITEETLRIRDGLDNKKAIPSRPTSEVEFQKFVKTRAGKWQNIFETKKIEDEDGEETIVFETDDEEELISAIKRKKITKEETLRIREELDSKYSVEFTKENFDSRILKLRDSEGNLIDPEDAKEEEEYELVLIARRDKELVEFTEENNKVTYNKVYQNSFWSKENWLGSRAKLPENPISEVSLNASDLEIRNVRPFDNEAQEFFFGDEVRLQELAIFAFMLLPYIGTDLALSGIEAVNNPNPVGLALSTPNFINAVNNLRYFTGGEITSYLLHNFYTISLLKRHSIKFPQNRVVDTTREWDGEPDIRFGGDIDATGFLKRRRDRLLNFRDAARSFIFRRTESSDIEDIDDGSAALTEFKDDLSPRITMDTISPFTILIKKPENLIEGDKESQRESEFTNVIDTRREEAGFKNDVSIFEGERINARFAIRNRGRETNNINDLQIGSILVAPVVDEPFREVNNLPRFHIPFQFNPNISESGVEAKYEAVSVLSRIGELFSYSSTTSLTITLETEYIATADNETNEVGTDGNNWMSFYTLEKLQAIEKAYRSLVLPHYPTENDLEQGYVYVKPPLLRVIMGGSNKEPGDSGPYANILTYGRNSMTNGIADSSGVVFSSNSRLKNFIATSVTIKKDLYENPIVLDKEGKILDAMRFNVNLNLTEVSTNYLDSLPDYKRHSNIYRETMPNFILAARPSGQET